MALETPQDGPAFYDNDTVFDVYMKHRNRKADSPNEALERPVIMELIGPLAGQRILDLGCGEAGLGLEAIEQGCQLYMGVDGSEKMIASAKERLDGTQGKVELASIETWNYPKQTFDLVVARLSLHYIADLPPVFDSIFTSLASDGTFVFSVEHPVITSCARGWSGNAPRQDWLVDDYFVTGKRVTSWLGGTVVKYHRTIEQYYRMLDGAGFTITGLREATPIGDNFEVEENFKRRQRIPLFLIMAGQKS